MEQDRIRELLEKFEKAETSLNEEAILRSYFTSNEVIPEDLQAYKMYFNWTNDFKEVKAPASLTNRITNQLHDNIPGYMNTKIVVLKRWSSWAAAAIVLLIASFWFINTNSNQFSEENELVYQETYDDPEKAYEQTVQALAFLSNKLNRGQKKATGSMKKLKELDQAIPNY